MNIVCSYSLRCFPWIQHGTVSETEGNPIPLRGTARHFSLLPGMPRGHGLKSTAVVIWPPRQLIRYAASQAFNSWFDSGQITHYRPKRLANAVSLGKSRVTLNAGLVFCFCSARIGPEFCSICASYRPEQPRELRSDCPAC